MATSSYLTRPARELEHVRALREVVIPDASPYAFPQAARAPRGTHVCGHTASIVWFLTWAAAQPRSWSYYDLGWNTDAQAAFESAILNRYVECPSGLPIPAAYCHSSVRFQISAAGRAVLDRAAAATGDGGHAAATGRQSIAVAVGDGGVAQAGPDGWLVLASYTDGGNLREVRALKVGADGVEPGQSYRLNARGKVMKVDA